MNKISINELFSGIGAQRKAFERIGITYEVIGISEIDKYAIQSYEAMFGETRNYGDITKIERLDYADLWTYSFPCQDISVAGNQKGIFKGTRSGLLYEVQRLLNVASEEGTLPKYLLLENVKNLVGKKFKSQFDNWLFYLQTLGYNTFWQVLNAKDYGIPQNRERVFALSIRKDLDIRYEFPKKENLNIRLADLLENEVDEKFYLKQSLVDFFIKNSLINEQKGNGFRFKPHNPDNANVAFAITTRAGARMDDNFILSENLSDKSFFQFDKKGIMTIKEVAIGASRGRNPNNPSNRTVGSPTQQRFEVNKQGLSNTVTTVQKDNLVLEHNYKLKGPIRLGGIFDKSGQKHQAGSVWDKKAISPTIDTMQGGYRQPLIIDDVVEIENSIRIRKLTPLECWRLMGFDDEDFKKAQASGVSNTQLYKQAGNSIVVNVLIKIFKNLIESS